MAANSSSAVLMSPAESKVTTISTRRRRSRYSSSGVTNRDQELESDGVSIKKSRDILRESEACEDLTLTKRGTKRRVKAKRSQNLKLRDIETALKANPVDITSLRQLAITRGGLETDHMRCKVWPHLLSVNVWETSPKPLMSDVMAYRDYTQVLLDVNRCLKRFPPDIDEDVRLSMQNQLAFLIVRILMKNPQLHYYQGFHDICITFLLAVGEELSFALIEQLTKAHLKNFMDTTMEKTVQMLNYLYPIIGRENPQVREHMEKAGVGTIFCLSWLITWFGHVLNDYRHIVRLYDFFLANDPLMPVYLAAAIVLYRENEILETECDMAMLHSFLSKIPQDLPFEDLISKTGDLFLNYPPSEFEAEVAELNKSGLMKFDDPAATGDGSIGRDPLKVMSLRYGQIWSCSRLSFLVAPPWLRQQKNFVRLVVCTAVATGATVLYSYLAHGHFMAFLSHR